MTRLASAPSGCGSGSERARPAWRTATAVTLFGVVLLLVPVPARLKEWAYAGFAIDLGSALIAHLLA